MSDNQAMAYYKITRLATGGYVVKDGFHDVVFSSTRIDESLIYIKSKLCPDEVPNSLVPA